MIFLFPKWCMVVPWRVSPRKLTLSRKWKPHHLKMYLLQGLFPACHVNFQGCTSLLIQGHSLSSISISHPGTTLSLGTSFVEGPVPVANLAIVTFDIGTTALCTYWFVTKKTQRHKISGVLSVGTPTCQWQTPFQRCWSCQWFFLEDLAMKPPSTESKFIFLLCTHVHYVYLGGCESMPKPCNRGEVISIFCEGSTINTINLHYPLSVEAGSMYICSCDTVDGSEIRLYKPVDVGRLWKNKGF